MNYNSFIISKYRIYAFFPLLFTHLKRILNVSFKHIIIFTSLYIILNTIIVVIFNILTTLMCYTMLFYTHTLGIPLFHSIPLLVIILPASSGITIKFVLLFIRIDYNRELRPLPNFDL